jgi:hypothetical protein
LARYTLSAVTPPAVCTVPNSLDPMPGSILLNPMQLNYRGHNSYSFPYSVFFYSRPMTGEKWPARDHGLHGLIWDLVAPTARREKGGGCSTL